MSRRGSFRKNFGAPRKLLSKLPSFRELISHDNSEEEHTHTHTGTHTGAGPGSAHKVTPSKTHFPSRLFQDSFYFSLPVVAQVPVTVQEKYPVRNKKKIFLSKRHRSYSDLLDVNNNNKSTSSSHYNYGVSSSNRAMMILNDLHSPSGEETFRKMIRRKSFPSLESELWRQQKSKKQII